MKRMLFNATQAEELRVAIVDGQKLIDLDIESAAKEQRKSNIYKGVITRIEPSLEAAFVNYGEERHGFLPFKEVSRSYFQPGVEAGKASIKEALREGQEVIVQVEKDERGNKGAALTTFVSLAGRYLVLMPNNPRGGGVSRRVEGDERAELRDLMDQLQVPGGMSLIARTAGIGRSLEELQWDLNYLMQLWSAIEGAATSQSGPFLIYLEGSLVIRAIRDYFQPDIGEILIDTDEVYEQARAFMETVMPANVNRVKLYRDDVPLFSRFQIEHQIESAYSRQVNLPSGGAIVIDHTEALVSVDVNSGRATRGQDIEETAFKTNQEAADEMARQLRLRDLGGLIVIDFIDMESPRNQREVENRLRDALRHDRARVQMGKISRFGLMELSRQRLRPALAETSYIPCPRCTGTGHIRSTESAALHILRILEEEAMKDNTAAVHVQVPVDVATFLLNEKRPDIQAIELRHKVNILLIPNIHLETPAHTILRLRHDDLNQEDLQQPSYRMMEAPAEEAKQAHAQGETVKPRQEAAIKHLTPEQPAPMAAEKPAAEPKAEAGIISKIFSWFRGNRQPEPTPEPTAPARNKGRPQQRDGQPRGEQRSEGRGRGRGRGRNEGEGREGRGERSERNDARQERQQRQETVSEPRESQQPREGRRQRGERSQQAGEQPRQEKQERRERQPRGERATEEKAAQVVVNASVESIPNEIPSQAPGGEETGGRGRRGRRGGRRERGERRPEAVVSEGETQNVSAEAVAVEAAPAPAPEAVPAVPVPVTVTVVDATEAVQAEATSTAIEPAPVMEALVETPPAAETTPEPVAVAVEPAVAKVEAEIAAPAKAAPIIEAEVAAPAAVFSQAAPAKAAEDLGQALSGVGLVMVETTAQAQPVVAPAPEPRGRKVRPVTVVVSDEPLQLVETQK
ncbi:MAG: Rne/Rng family ribonuclease [Betaproteobacteria bacterium]|nr:Rne/Rng family ribonuclease [Betaproteobacteria bacterium]